MPARPRPEAQAGRTVLHEAGIPAYDTPLRAVRGFMHIVQYRRGQRALQRTPPSVPETRSDTHLVRAIVQGALADKREILTEPEAKRVLAAYGIPVVPTEIVLETAKELIGEKASLLGRPLTVSDDVAEFLTHIPGCYFQLGAKPPELEQPTAHHSPFFRIDEASFATGVRVLAGSAVRLAERDFLPSAAIPSQP